MTYKNVGIKPETEKLIEEAREEFLKHHPEFKEIHLSYNKLIYEIAQYYINH